MNNVSCILDDVAKIIIQFSICYFNHYIAGIVVAFTHYFFPVLHLVYFLHRKKNLLHYIAPATAGNFLIQVFFYLSFLSTYHTQNIPFGFLLLRLFLCIGC